MTPARRKGARHCQRAEQDPLTDEEIEADLANYRAELLAGRKAQSASKDGHVRRA